MQNLNEGERRDLLSKTGRDILSIEAGLDQMWVDLQDGREDLERIATFVFNCGETPDKGVVLAIESHPGVPVAERIMQAVSGMLSLCHYRELVAMRDRLKASLPE